MDHGSLDEQSPEPASHAPARRAALEGRAAIPRADMQSLRCWGRVRVNARSAREQPIHGAWGRSLEAEIKPRDRPSPKWPAAPLEGTLKAASGEA